MLDIIQNAKAQWCYTDSEGQQHVDVVAVRAFPLSAPEQGVSIVSSAGHELQWIEDLAHLDNASQMTLATLLAQREFMPEILSINTVSSYATPSVWAVMTDKGETEFTLKGEEDIRRLTHTRLLIADSNGLQFVINDIEKLDHASRRRLDRFL
ncbi:DUF1854 domain-containing protein [Sulfuriferula nivalis]|uniref:DUF1854 domain-containing protein n=1 Tax=Sulfuriferula nivalis TaxID=2675298 RepID=A0A809RIS5_9PROT|nr:DUF1854 domain-containing protein [Sulfuriferula nivalis]BBP01405.1 hypothetical protein SFSGTM_21130 [Sulfuriferula nivalis]